MLRRTFKISAILLASVLWACQSALVAEETNWLDGRVANTSGAPIQSEIHIDGVVVKTNARGEFAISLSAAPVYRMSFEADGYYPMRHTFSRAELEDSAALGEIVLVERKPDRTLFVFGGDAMIGRRFYDPFDGEPVLVREATRLEDSKALLAEMKPYLDLADYASINLETPIFDTPPGDSAPKSVTFFSAPETLAALEWSGVDYVALGNNHVYDFLEPGLDATLDELSRSELDYSGAGKTETEALKPHRTILGGTSYDLFSYVGWPAGPPTQSAEAAKGGAALGTVENLLSTTQQSLREGGVPILQFHGGLEYVEEPTLGIETKLKRAVDAGAGLVVAHHPHVTQGLELFEGKLIAWSLGNFLFDQYFYSAQSAALLYVWMDGDEFHHAETVPLYIKGYHPTPALGAMRNKINRRMFELSKKRNTHLRRSGGHLVLFADNRAEANTVDFVRQTDCQTARSRTGKDLLARGDFDSHALFGATDRSWIDLDPRIEIRSKVDAPWDFALFANIPGGETVTTGMRKFQRVFARGTPITVRASVSSATAARVDIYLQLRADGQSLDDALKNGTKIKIGSAAIGRGDAQDVDIDFDSPRTRVRSLRVLLAISGAGDHTQVEIDNLQLIQWDTPFAGSDEICQG